MISQPLHSESEHEAAVGWIATAELFLLVGSLLLGMVLLFQARAGEERRKNELRLGQDAERKKQLQEREREVASLQKQLQDRDRQVGDLPGQIKRLRELLANAENRLKEERAKLNKVIAELTRDKKDLESKLAASTTTVADLKAEIKSLNTSLADAENRLKDERAKLNKVIVELTRDKKDLESKLAASTTTVADLKAEIKSLNTSLADAKGRLKEEIGELAKLKVFIASLRSVPEEVLGLKSRDGKPMKRVAILIDTSGSMGWSHPVLGNRWDFTKNLLKTWLKNLNVEEAVVIEFNTTVKVVAGKPINLRDKKKKDDLLRIVEGWNPRGHTNTLGALKKAYEFDDRIKAPLDAILLFTDGQPDDPPAEIVALAKEHGHIPINTIGVGDYTKDQKFANFLIELAKETKGSFQGR